MIAVPAPLGSRAVLSWEGQLLGCGGILRLPCPLFFVAHFKAFTQDPSFPGREGRK